MTLHELLHWLAQFQGWRGIYFFASFEQLLAILVGVVALWQFGVARLFRKPRTWTPETRFVVLCLCTMCYDTCANVSLRCEQ